jgi:hypothetical protein
MTWKDLLLRQPLFVELVYTETDFNFHFQKNNNLLHLKHGC